jgi:hypothetical protein
MTSHPGISSRMLFFLWIFQFYRIPSFFFLSEPSKVRPVRCMLNCGIAHFFMDPLSLASHQPSMPDELLCVEALVSHVKAYGKVGLFRSQTILDICWTMPIHRGDNRAEERSAHHLAKLSSRKFSAVPSRAVSLGKTY